MAIEPGERPIIGVLLAVLDRYFEALENGAANQLQPDPSYVWRIYAGEMTSERLRRGLRDIDEYLEAQIGWVNNNLPEVKLEGLFQDGPELNRLPDNAVECLFQELDSLLAQEASFG